MLTEGVYAGEAILSEAEGCRSRDVVVIGAGQTLMPGTVLAMITAAGATKGQYVAFNPAGQDGSQLADAVLLHKTTTAAGVTAKATAFTRDCEVRASALQFAAGVTAAQQATAIAVLAATGIIARS